MRIAPRFVAPVLLAVAALVAMGCTSTTDLVQNEDVESRPIATSQLPAPTEQDVEPSPEEGAATGSESSESSESETQDEGGAGEIGGSESETKNEGRAVDRISDIRTVDFFNGFTHVDAAYGGLTATVADGEYTNGELGDEEFFWFNVNDVQFGDLNGDGVEEALVVAGYSGGGSGFFQSVAAYQLVDGVVTHAGSVPFGDRAFGGIADLTVADGIASVLMFTNGEGSCCPNEVSNVRLVLGEHFLAEADVQRNLAWIALSQFEEQRLLKFLPGTSGAYAGMWGDDLDSSFALEAGPGQVMTIEVVDGPLPTEVVIIDTTTGERVGAGASAVLPSDAIYEITVKFDEARQESTTLLVQIDHEPEPISWVPHVEQVVVGDDPVARSTLTWPAFSSETADPGAVLAANNALAAMARGTDDLWVADVIEFPPLPDQESSYELQYQVSYAVDDVVSVRFNFYDYVCCRPYPNYGPMAAILDLRTGRIIDPGEILTLNRGDEIRDLWAAGLESQGQLPAELLDTIDLTDLRFESISLVPEGIEFGTGRGVVSGGSPGTSVVLTFEELGDLVQPDFLTRLGR